LAKVFLALKSHAQALKYAQDGLEMAKEMGQKAQIRDLSESLSKTYKAMGKYELALVHYEQFKFFLRFWGLFLLWPSYS
jgi:CDP-diacylglycerol pyrophosphatase